MIKSSQVIVPIKGSRLKRVIIKMISAYRIVPLCKNCIKVSVKKDFLLLTDMFLTWYSLEEKTYAQPIVN